MVMQMLTRLSQRSLIIAACSLCSFFFFTTFYPWRAQSFEYPLVEHPVSTDCHHFQNDAGVQLIVKTGANEIYEKLPTQLLTSLRCYENEVLIFSDLEQVIGPYHVHDALANVTESVKASPQFAYYHQLQKMRADRQDINTKDQKGKDGWDLDKFKFLHMLEKTFYARPGLQWYVFIEADTYLFRSNLLLWLKRLDSSKPLYIGSPAFANGDLFSHGGSGFILSGAALAQFTFGDPGIAVRYDEKMKQEQYGDQGLTKALGDKKIKLTSGWPSIQGEAPSTLPFGPGPGDNGEYWCQPLVTMHHVSPDDVARMWEVEQARPNQEKPFLPEELYYILAKDFVDAQKDDWDNISDDVFYRAPGVRGDRQKKVEEMSRLEKDAYLSFDNCAKACEEQKRCYQFLYQDKICSFAFSFRFGKRSPSYKSGWPMKRIAQFRKSKACKKPQWL